MERSLASLPSGNQRLLMIPEPTLKWDGRRDLQGQAYYTQKHCQLYLEVASYCPYFSSLKSLERSGHDQNMAFLNSTSVYLVNHH